MSETMDGPESTLSRLDPFSFHGHTASVIKGIGGATPNADPTYAFHTEYVRLARGRAHFEVTLFHLAAKQGTLVLRVHLLPDEPGAVARMVTSERIQLNRLALNLGRVDVTFEAFRGARYALMGLVAGQTDASASDILIRVDRLYDDAEAAMDARRDGAPTRFGNRTGFKGAAHIVEIAAPSFKHPTSQIATRAQLRETAYVARCRELGLTSPNEFMNWSSAYMLQSLDGFEMLQPGAEGLILGEADEALVALIAKRGCRVTIVGPQAPSASDEAVHYLHAAAPENAMALDLLDFDFVCGSWIGASIDAKLVERLMEWSFSCLRPQGLAVHVVGTGAYAPHITRTGLERICLNLLSQGHDVAQLRLGPYQPSFDREPGAAGFIARRTSRWL